MNKQREIIVTVTYNDLGIIVDTKAEERKKGKWIDGFCSECHQEAITEWNDRGGEYAFTRYCPNCGARMK